MRGRVSLFLAWGSGWRAACFPLPRGWGAGQRRGSGAGGPEARPGEGDRPREPPLRAGPVGSLVLRPKPSPIGLASPFPKATGRAGHSAFLSAGAGASGGLAGLPRPPNLGPRCLGMGFIVKEGMGNSWRFLGRSGGCRGAPWARGSGARGGGGGGAAATLPAPGKERVAGPPPPRPRPPGRERALCR